MLISNLGRTRTELLNSFSDLTDEQINRTPGENSWGIAQVLHHLYTSEKETAVFILNAVQTKSVKVADKDLSLIVDGCNTVKAPHKPSTDFFTKDALIQLLEESRFLHLQSVFNETHERILAEKSAEHPTFGIISLKNFIDSIWLHDQHHIDQIYRIRQSLVSVPDAEQ